MAKREKKIEKKTVYQIGKTTYRPSSVFKELMSIDTVVASDVDVDIFHEVLDLHIFRTFNVQGKLEDEAIGGYKAEILKHIAEDYDNTFTFEDGLSFSIFTY
jgi:hypothetical protein